jgi:hypothetical protein
MITIGGNAVFDKNYLVQDTTIRIWYGHHAKTRLEERCRGSLNLKPEYIKLNRNSVRKGYLEGDKLVKFIARIDYSKSQFMYLAIVDSDRLEGQYFVKSLWFRDKNQRRNVVPINNDTVDPAPVS